MGNIHIHTNGFGYSSRDRTYKPFESSEFPRENFRFDEDFKNEAEPKIRDVIDISPEKPDK